MPATTNGKVKTIELADLFGRRVRTVAVQFTDDDADTFEVTYSPDVFTKQFQAEMAAAESEDVAALSLHRLLKRWNLTVEGEPWPLTVENVEALGFSLIRLIVGVIQADMTAHVTPGKATSTAPSAVSSGT